MKRIPIFFLFLLMSLTVLAQQNHYTIKGTGENISDGDTIYLCNIQGFFSIQKLDSTIVRNGEYCFTGSHPGCEIRYVMPFKNGKFAGLLAIMLENADITIHSYDADNKKEPDITGGENHTLWRSFKDIQKKWSDKMVPHWMVTRDTTALQSDKLHAQHIVDSLSLLQKEEEYQFMLDHLPSSFSDLILGSNYKSFTPKQKKNALAAFKTKCPDGVNYKRILFENEANASVEIGKKFTDFTMKDPNGKEISVGAYVKKNKFTLVDFWASWCGPCRAEMPYVLEAYKKYHDQGLEIIGVSLDNKHDAWVKSISSLKLPWPQMSDLKAWQSEGAKLYNVKSIPANVLINRKGVIVARNLRGLTLINTIGELIK